MRVDGNPLTVPLLRVMVNKEREREREREREAANLYLKG
jgi:hypothetical protein